MRAAAALLSLVAASSAAPETASSVCVYNAAAFVLKWHLKNADTGLSSGETSSYPVGQVKCLDASKAGSGVNAGAKLEPVVKAVWGKEITVSKSVLYDPVNVSQITYTCRGTTLSFHCDQGPMPPTAANVSLAVGKFLLGFVEGLGSEIGFANCITDLDKTFHDIVSVVDFFESGVNMKAVSSVVKAFEVLAGLLMDFGKAIIDCVKDAENFAQKVKDLAAALSGDVLSILKIVVEDAIHIFRDVKEITADVKAVAADWRAADYQGSGKAVGDIVGIILDGL
eukprot:TRINITY_DN1169_c0_g2_i1.p1 TRINITY_DN1169_c0_g2~~TRINITY_DN1169_c0_g2_i1.p1  ORF type:complete len:282 (+),score=119.78 TRINITY_DN1169_c0_g2_i1:66-911(+)